MQPKTEELLHMLLCAVDKLARPTFRNLTDSYETWAYRNGLARQLRTLERQKLIECDSRPNGDRLHRLTEQGRLHVLGGRDPEARWERHWDGRWRLALYDVPETQKLRREKVRRYLRARSFGCLQGSVWVTPDPVHEERDILAGAEIDVRSLLLLEARPCSGESDAEIVNGAWNFETINRRYTEYIKTLDQRPVSPPNNTAAAKSLQAWAAREREAWRAAVTVDPFLPRRLLPPGYLGCQAWERRIRVLRDAGRQLQKFRL